MKPRKSTARRSKNGRSASEPSPAKPLNVLIVEDVEDDALLVVLHLGKHGYDLNWQRVETPEALDAALRNVPWDVVICDYNLPSIDVPSAIGILRHCGFDLPFIVVSGTIGEERAADVMKTGAHDLIVKSNLSRLAPAIERELKDAEERRAKAMADEQLDTERRLLGNLMANAPDAVYFRDLSHRYIRLNAAEARIIDVDSVESAIGKRVDEIMPPDRAELRIEEEKRLFATGEPLIDRIEKVQQKDGTARWFSATKAPIRDQQGRIVGLVGITRDVTNRMRAEQALAASEAFFRAIVDYTPAAVVIKDLEGRNLVVNRVFCGWYGKTPEWIVGKTHDDFLDKEAAERVRAQERLVLETKTLVVQERRVTYPDGVARDVLVQKFPILGSGGEPIAIGTGVIDITERKRMENTLRAKTEELELVLDHMDQGIYAVDSDLTCTLLNRRFAELHGFPSELARPGVKFEDLARFNALKGRYGPGDVEKHVRLRMELAGENYPMRYEFDLLNGRIVELRSNPLPNGGFVRTVTDITELKQRETALRRSEERLSGAIQSLQEGFALFDVADRLVAFNAEYARVNPSAPEALEKGLPFERILRTNVERGAIPEAAGREEEFIRERMKAHRNPKGQIIRRFSDGKTYILQEARTPDGGIALSITDVTSLRKTEDALRESEELFRTVVNNSPAAVTLKDRQGRYLLANATFARWMNLSLDRIVGKTTHDLFSKKDADEITESDRKVFDNGGTIIFERERSFGDGIVRNIIAHKCPIFSADGKVHAINVTLSDITNFKKAERARRKSEERLGGAIESLQEGFALFDKDDRIVALNEKYRKMHPDAQRIMEAGGTFEDLSRSIVARGAILDAVGREEEFIRERLGRHRRPQGPIVLRFADGRWRIIQESHTPEGGRALSYVDITELKEAEDEIRKLSSAVEQAPLGLMITDTEGAIEYVNAAFTELTGYGSDEAIGRNPRMLQSGRTPPETYREMWSTVTAGKVWRGTFANKRKDGRIYPAATIVSPITTADGSITHYVGAQEDVTRQMERENLLKQMEKVESLGSLAGGIAHDFNNMLLPILALTQMTLNKLPASSEHRERLEKVVQAAGRARDLVAQILKFSRSEELKPEIVDIGKIMDEALGLLRTTLPSTVRIKDSRGLDGAQVFADAAQIGTVLMNLASNAADAMEGRPGEIEYSLSRHVIGDEHLMGFENAKAGPYVKIAVRDTGQGMDEATMKRIFEPFFTTKGVGKGTGLGLATAYGIVTKHGGMIYVASEVGKGTTFDIYLPLVDDTEAGKPPAGGTRDTRVRGSENAAAMKG